MSYWVLEYDYTDMDARAAARPDHLAYMTGLHEQGVCVMAGPIGEGAGAMGVFRADSEEAVREVIAGDPYTAAGAAGNHRIRPWNAVIGG
ncbi:MAG TPA: YciI family protein [Dermatophilaceae bacterium]|nr:YciI family protein [Dermatophilaceae bacterium]